MAVSIQVVAFFFFFRDFLLRKWERTGREKINIITVIYYLGHKENRQGEKNYTTKRIPCVCVCVA